MTAYDIIQLYYELWKAWKTSDLFENAAWFKHSEFFYNIECY